MSYEERVEEEVRLRAETVAAVAAAGGDTSVLAPTELRRFRERIRPVDEVGQYLPEADDPNVLIFGPWLERGGSAFWVSTSGTGKSTMCMQFVHCASAGIPFCGLRPRGKLKFWVFQSEDSPRRVAQDRIDVRAELSEQHPEIDWEAVGRTVKFVSLPGKIGVGFLAALDELLEMAKREGEMPDVIVLNPLLAYIGGPVTDGKYVTPFLRGGDINGDETEGLQALLMRHGVGVLVYHHTPKPPTEKELDAWMKSRFPEYQGAGSSDLTNWGRSFVMMMRVQGHPNMVCCTAGKNGAELGWEMIGGAYRHYLAYSNGGGVSGKARHAWRELDDAEYEQVVNKAKSDGEKKQDDVTQQIAAEIKDTGAVSKTEMLTKFAGKWSRAQIRLATFNLYAKPEKYGLTVKAVLRGRGWVQYIGQAESLRRAAQEGSMEWKLAQAAENRGGEASVEATVAPPAVPQGEETPQEPSKTAEEEDLSDVYPF